MACSCSTDDRLRRVLMVRRLHPAVTMQSLLQSFGAFGCITGCKVFTHKSGRSAGCASVEFASHTAACAAFKQLQGTQLSGKAIHLQWFDHTIAQSPGRTISQHVDLAASPGAHGGTSILAGRSSFSNALQAPSTPHSKTPKPAPNVASSAFGLLATSPTHYCNETAVAAAAVVAAAHQHHLVKEHQRQQHAAATALFANSSRQLQTHGTSHLYPQQQQLQRQISAPISSGFGQLSLHLPPSPHPSTGGAFDALASPELCMHGRSDPGRTAAAAAAAAAVANLSAAMAAIGMKVPGQDSNSNLAALQQMAAIQQQQQVHQQLAALALQHISANNSAQPSDDYSSPVRSVHCQRQQQASVAAALHNKQRHSMQQRQQQLLGQLPSATQMQQQHEKVKLQLARSMPAELGVSLDSSFGSSSGSCHDRQQRQSLGSIAAALQRHHQEPFNIATQQAAGSTDSLNQISPFALHNQQLELDSSASTAMDCNSAAQTAAVTMLSTAADAAQCASDSKITGEGHQAKKQLFPGGDEANSFGFGLFTSSSQRGGLGSCAGAASVSAFEADAQQHDPSLAFQAQLQSHASGTNDATVAGVDTLAAALAASSAAAASGGFLASSYPVARSWTWGSQALDVLTPELLSALQQCGLQEREPDHSLHRYGSAASAAAQQQQHLLASTSQPALPPLSPQGQQQLQCNVPYTNTEAAGMMTVDAAAVGDWSSHPGAVHVRASDSQVMLGAAAPGSSKHLNAAASHRLSSPSLPGSLHSATRSERSTGDNGMLPTWQNAQGHCSSTQRGSSIQSSLDAISSAAIAPPAAHAFKHKHKQQLHLELPEYDDISAPLTSARVSRPCESFDQLITTEVLPESPAHALLPSPLAAATTPASNSSTTVAISSHCPAQNLMLGRSETGSAVGSSWADWSSMAALLSPVHVSHIVTRRYTDCYVPSAPASVTLLQQHEQQQLRQQHSRSAADFLTGAASEHGRGVNDMLDGFRPDLGPLQEQQQVASMLVGADAAETITASMAMEQQQQDNSISLLGKTRHSSLCLDVHSQLLPLELQSSPARAAIDGGSTAFDVEPSSSGSAGIGCNRHVRRALLCEGSGLYSSGSFTFQPLLQQQQQLSASRLPEASSSSSAMITEPFQMPAFFRSSGSCADSSSAARSVSRTASMHLPAVAEGDSLSSQTHEPCQGADVVQEPAAILQSQLQHSLSMPASVDAVIEVGSPAKMQQQQDEVAYSNVFRSLWGEFTESSPTKLSAELA